VASQESVTVSTSANVRRLGRVALIGLALVALTGIIAPFLDGSRFSGQIQQTLATSLGRQVNFESVHFTFFSGPGFSLENVTINEDRRYGLAARAHPDFQFALSGSAVELR
jgi:hypothetical protein